MLLICVLAQSVASVARGTSVADGAGWTRCALGTRGAAPLQSAFVARLTRERWQAGGLVVVDLIRGQALLAHARRTELRKIILPKQMYSAT